MVFGQAGCVPGGTEEDATVEMTVVRMLEAAPVVLPVVADADADTDAAALADTARFDGQWSGTKMDEVARGEYPGKRLAVVECIDAGGGEKVAELGGTVAASAAESDETLDLESGLYACGYLVDDCSAVMTALGHMGFPDTAESLVDRT